MADETRRYIESRPSIRDCVAYDIVNFTALARRIRADTGLPSQEAIEIACRRYRRQLQEEPPLEERLRGVLRASNFQLRNHLAVLTVQGDLELMDRLVVGAQRMVGKRSGVVKLFQGSGLVTILCESSVLGSILNVAPRNAIIHMQSRLAALSIQSPEEVLFTPRVFGFIADALGRAGINCIEVVSVHTDTLFVLRPNDAVKAFEMLTDLIRDFDEEEDKDLALPKAPATGRSRREGPTPTSPSDPDLEFRSSSPRDDAQEPTRVPPPPRSGSAPVRTPRGA